MPLNIGLIGAGRMGSTLAHHLAFAVDSANLIAIADLTKTMTARPRQNVTFPTYTQTTKSFWRGIR